MNETSLENSLSFHGRDLFNEIHEKSVVENDVGTLEILKNFKNRNSLKSHQYSRRSSMSEIDDYKKFETRLQKFIVKKRKYLFAKKKTIDWEKLKPSASSSKDKKNDAQCEISSSIGAPPSFEKFLSIPKREEEERFFTDLQVGDAVCVEVRSVENYSVNVRFLCLDGHLQRDVNDLNIETFIGRDEFTKATIAWNEISKRTLLRAVVLSLDVDKREINLTLAPHLAKVPPFLRLGIITENDLPAYFRNGEKHCKEDYDKCLRKSNEFQNPNAVELLCEQFELPLCGMISFLDPLNNFDSSPDTFASSLRRVQTHKLSMKSVAKGVERLRQNETTIAMQHFNKALQVEPDNAEALVGRGALYANKESFMLAIKDFEDALRLDEDHSNAKKYLLETLLAQCKIYNQKRKRKRAKLFCRRILELDPSNDEGKRLMAKFTLTLNRNDSESDTANGSDSSVVEIEKNSNDRVKKPSPTRRKRKQIAQNPDNDIKYQLRELYKKYGVDEKQFVDDPDLLEKLKKYHEKYSKTMKLNKNKTQTTSEKEVLSSYSDGSSTSSSSSSRSSPRKESSSKRKKPEDLEKTYAIPTSSAIVDSLDNTYQRQITEEKRPFLSSRYHLPSKIFEQRESHSNSKNTNSIRSDQKQNDKPLSNGQSASVPNKQPSKLVEETKLKIGLKNMESFINTLKKSKQN